VLVQLFRVVWLAKGHVGREQREGQHRVTGRVAVRCVGLSSLLQHFLATTG
jgi:hypothetical protein